MQLNTKKSENTIAKGELDRLLAQLLSTHAIGGGGLGYKSRVGQIGTVSPTARYRCSVPS